MAQDIKVTDILSREQRAALSQRQDRAGLIFLCGHMASLGVTGWLLYGALGTLWIVPATVLHGFVIVHLFSPFHECSHGTTFKTRWMNTALFWLCGLILMLPPHFFRLEHAAHHAFTGNPQRDPERIPMADRLGGFLLYGSAIPYFRNILHHLIFHPLGRFTEVERGFIAPHSRRRVQRQAWVMWAVYLTIAAVSLALQSWAALLFWVIPRVVSEPFQRFIRMTEHVGCPLVPSMLRNTRTTLVATPLRWLAWNMPLHAEHHVISSVPFHALPALHRDLAPHLGTVSKGYLAAEAEIVRAALSAEAAGRAGGA